MLVLQILTRHQGVHLHLLGVIVHAHVLHHRFRRPLVVLELIRDDRARTRIEAEAQVRQLAPDRLLVVIWVQELAEPRVRRECDGGGDCPRCRRETQVAPYAAVCEVDGYAE